MWCPRATSLQYACLQAWVRPWTACPLLSRPWATAAWSSLLAPRRRILQRSDRLIHLPNRPRADMRDAPLAMFRLRPVQGGLGHGLLGLRAHGRQERVRALLPHLQAEGPLPQQHGTAASAVAAVRAGRSTTSSSITPPSWSVSTD